MSAKKEKKRTSILKRRQSSGEQEEETTTGFNTKRKLMFSRKKEVIEFAQCEDRLTIWGNKYETSVARSEGGSTDSGGASTSRCVSTDFNSMQVSHTATATTISIFEADKENRQIIGEENLTVAETFPREESIAVNSFKQAPDVSIFTSSHEIVNLKETSVNLTLADIMNPKPGIVEVERNKEVHHSKAFPEVKSKVNEHLKKKSPGILSNVRLTMSLEEDEKEREREEAAQRTMNKTVDMNISLVQKKSLTHFKCPEIQKETKSRAVDRSPPIKPDFQYNKQDLEEIYENLALETPIKNLCCLTPQRSASKAQAMSKVKRTELFQFDLGPSMLDDKAQSFHSDMSESTLESTDELGKKAARLLRNPNATLGTLSRPSLCGSPSSTLTSFDDSIDISKPLGIARSTTYALQDMSVNAPFQIFHDSMEENPRGTIYNQEMSINEGARKSLNNEFEEDSDQTLVFHPRKSIRDSIMVHKAHNNRGTTYDAKGMDESTSEKLPIGKFEQKSRGTIYDNAMDESEIEKHPMEKIEPKAFVKPLATNRATTFQQNEMELSASEDYAIIPQHKNAPGNVNFPTKPRATTFQQNDMDVSSFEDQAKSVPHHTNASKQRATSYQQNEMDESTNEIPKASQVPLKHRTTTYQQDEMDLSTSEDQVKMPSSVYQQKNVNYSNKSRASTYQQSEMDLSIAEIQAKKQTAHKPTGNENFLSKPRVTTFQNNEMDLSTHGVQGMKEVPQNAQGNGNFSNKQSAIQKSKSDTPIVPKSSQIPLKNRATTYQNDEMDMSTQGNQEVGQNAAGNKNMLNRPRVASLNMSTMSVTSFPSQETTKHKNLTTGPRVTTYQHSDMDESRNDGPIPQQIPLKGRGTIFNQEMELSSEQFEVKSNASKPRTTTFKHNEMEMSLHIPKSRATTFEQNNMETSARGDENLPQSFKNRPTTFQNAMEMSRAETSLSEQSILRESQQNYGQNHIHRFSIFGTVNETIKGEAMPQEMDELDKTLTNEIEMSMKVPRRHQTIYDDQQMDDSASAPLMTLKSDQLKYRPTTFDQMDMNQSRVNVRATIFNEHEMDLSQAAPRPTIHQESEMELSGITEFSDDKILSPPSGFKSMQHENRAGPSRRKNSEDSVKWHNVTDAEMLGDDMLEDISSPIEISIEQQASKRAKVTLDGISRFEDAIDDFVNLTINSSPLNVTEDSSDWTLKGKAKRDTKRLSRPLLPNRDYESMLDALDDTLKKKNAPKPRLAIDDYLEKLHIAPVKIERQLDLEPAAIMERINAKKEEIRLRREERKKIDHERNLILPAIPDAAFLMQNYLDGMNDIIRDRIMREIVIRPIFPESMNFIDLLKNKFETDHHLAENWKLDTTFWYMKNFKLTHRKLVFYTISINSQQTPAEADDSTMPILFSQAILILGSKFRFSFEFTQKWQMMKNEFKNAFNSVDNFNSMCRSTTDLMSFLDYYHEKVMKVCEIVENFNKIVAKYGAVCVRDKKSNLPVVIKMHFLKPNGVGLVEVLNVFITVSSYINDISISDVSVEGKLFEYELNPSPSAKAMTGLMLLESILFDTQKFVEGNFNSREIIFE